MKKPSANGRALLYYLKNQYNYFKRKDELAPDGSFFKKDEKIAAILGTSSRTIKRGRKVLAENGLIRFVSGKHTGVATRYWILLKEVDNLSSSNTIQQGDNLSSFTVSKEGDNLSKEGDKTCKTGGQNVTPVLDISKDINKDEPAFSLEAYKGHTVETKSELEFLISKFGQPDVAKLVETGDIKLAEGIRIQ